MERTAPAIRFVDLQAQLRTLEPQVSDAMRAVLERGDFILGEAVAAFEREFAAYCGVAHAVGVDSGLSALELGLRAAGIGAGDEVITQANTFIATAGAILAVGARPVLVDCDPEGQIEVEAVAAAITPRTRAILPVHLYGRIGDIDGILQLAERAGLPVIEDACQAHGARIGSRRAGSFGLCAAFSFYPAKNLGAFGDGGMLTTNSDRVAAEVRMLRNYGSKVKYEHVMLPLNHRLDTIQAAVLRVKLPRLDAWNARRQVLADVYREQLDGSGVVVPRAQPQGRHVYHLFAIEVLDRDALRARLQEAGIETGVHYPIPLHRQPVLQTLADAKGAFPNAERLSARSLSLPMYAELPVEDVERVASAIRRAGRGERAA
ncbi:MAG TPA: DegT/DnrJ/EryC1/StrS family aminotransferase [Candidatus Limnocylindrales bacterium]|nr:DegT/DnrJ/EryC1/StrS family aminotransferase [Candidatus Limnocylindrales bacterium]